MLADPTKVKPSLVEDKTKSSSSSPKIKFNSSSSSSSSDNIPNFLNSDKKSPKNPMPVPPPATTNVKENVENVAHTVKEKLLEQNLNFPTPEEFSKLENDEQLITKARLIVTVISLKKRFRKDDNTTYSLDSSYRVIYSDFVLLKFHVDRHQGLTFSRGIFMLGVHGMEKGVDYMENPFGVDLTGWGNSVQLDLEEEFDDILLEIYDMYNKPGESMNPWLKLALALGLHGAKHNASRQAAKTKKMVSLDNALEKNPDLIRQLHERIGNRNIGQRPPVQPRTTLQPQPGVMRPPQRRQPQIDPNRSRQLEQLRNLREALNKASSSSSEDTDSDRLKNDNTMSITEVTTDTIDSEGNTVKKRVRRRRRKPGITINTN